MEKIAEDGEKRKVSGSRLWLQTLEPRGGEYLNNAARGILEGMSNDELDRMILHLGYYALKVSRGYRWRTGNPVELPGGETIDSIVSKALELVLEGKDRHWDQQKHPDLRKYLMDVIDSILYHLATGKENTMLTAVPQEGSEEEKDWHTGSRGREPSSDWLARQETTPEIALINRETEEREDEAIMLLCEMASGDPLLPRIIQAMLNGCGKPGEIAAVTGIEVGEVYTAMKRLDRKIKLVRRQILSQPAQTENDASEKSGRRRQS